MTTRRRTTDAGSASLELVVIGTVLLAFMGLAAGLGRVAVAGGTVTDAAAAAARAASLARTPAEAQTAAAGVARATLQQGGLHCESTNVSVDTTGFSVPLGQPAQIRAEVVCVVRLADLALPGIPGSKSLRSDFVSVLDPYRSRS